MQGRMVQNKNFKQNINKIQSLESELCTTLKHFRFKLNFFNFSEGKIKCFGL